MQPEAASSLRYRADVDGLRAVAVLLVVGFHAFPSVVTGGYVGVDIFFVISGFLITGLLLDDLKRKQFSFVGFYARRIRRIFPALLVVLAVCLTAGWILLLPREFSSLGINVFGGAAFSSNLVLLSQTGYFDVSAAEKPLLHLWSLGVEEQFYIFWPFILMLAFSRRVSILFAACILFALSFAASLAVIGTPTAFYLPVTRAWELMIGGALAAAGSTGAESWLRQRCEQVRSALTQKMPARLVAIASFPDLYAVTGIALIAIAVGALNKNSSFPGWLALLPTLGAALILTSGGAWLNRVFFANPTVVFVGLISYPLYLWHWPLLSFATIAEPTGTTPQIRSAAVLCAFGLAWLTYRWIERPIRTGARLPIKVIALCVAMTAMGAAGLTVFERQGLPERIPAAIRDITTIPLDEVADWRLHTCLLETDDKASQFTSDCLDHGRRPLLLLWGDSNAAALYPGLKRLQQSVDFGLAQYTTAGCPPLLSFPVQGRPRCVENNDFVFATLSNVHPDVVVLYSAWNYGDVYPRLSELITKLRALQIPRIIVMGPPPIWDGGLPKAAYDYYRTDPLHRLPPLRSSFRVADAWYGYEKAFRARVQEMGVDYISSWDALCNGKECQTRPPNDASQLMAFDYAHLTIPGAVYLAKLITPCLFPEEHSSVAPMGLDLTHVCSLASSKLRESRHR